MHEVLASTRVSGHETCTTTKQGEMCRCLKCAFTFGHNWRREVERCEKL
jgi:hypothetical protein